MQFLTENECSSWCKSHRIEFSSNLTARYVVDVAHSFVVYYENRSCASVIALLNNLTSPSTDEIFGGGLVWIKTWGVWSESSEQMAQTLMKQLRSANNESSILTDRPGTHFGPNELDKLQTFLAIPMLFGWDAFYFPDGQDYFLFISHDSWVDVYCRTEERFELEFKAASAWEPKAM